MDMFSCQLHVHHVHHVSLSENSISIMPIEVKQIPSEAISLLSKNLLLPLYPTESPQKNTQAFSCNKGPKIAF